MEAPTSADRATVERPYRRCAGALTAHPGGVDLAVCPACNQPIAIGGGQFVDHERASTPEPPIERVGVERRTTQRRAEDQQLHYAREGLLQAALAYADHQMSMMSGNVAATPERLTELAADLRRAAVTYHVADGTAPPLDR